MKVPAVAHRSAGRWRPQRSRAAGPPSSSRCRPASSSRPSGAVREARPPPSKEAIRSAEAALLHRRPNTLHPLPGMTPSQLAQAHSLLSPPPASALSALAARIPGFPLRLNHPSHLGAVEQCLVSPSFWRGVEEGDVRLDDLKKMVSRWTEPGTVRTGKADGKDGGEEIVERGKFLPGKVRATASPDQSMDAHPGRQPPGSKRRAELRKERAVEERQDLVPEPGWEEAVPRFTNFLDEGKLDNEAYAVLGNSVLGLLASEWLDREYPNLPTTAFSAALTMYVGPRTCADIARGWGISSGAGLSTLLHPNKPKLSSSPSSHFGGGQHSLGSPQDRPSRRRGRHLVTEEKSLPALLRWRRQGEGEGEGGGEGGATAWEQGVTYEDAMANAARAFVGLAYQKEGLRGARELVRANWLSRTADVAELVRVGNPRMVLKATLARKGMEPPVARLLRETGRLSASPIFIVGSYSGPQRLGEAFGSSLKMAEHRAHEDALRRIYLSRPSPPSTSSLPSDTLVSPEEPYLPLRSAGEGLGEIIGMGEVEVVEGSSGRTGRRADETVEEAGERRRKRTLVEAAARGRGKVQEAVAA